MRYDVKSLTNEKRDSVRIEQLMVAVHDTIVETTTITVRENEAGDTLGWSRVTERDRIRDRVALKNEEMRLVEKTDTVYVERRDTVKVRNHSRWIWIFLPVCLCGAIFINILMNRRF